MSIGIKFSNRVTNATEDTKGTDGRLDVSSRSDSRGYYNSRDDKLTFTVAYEMTDPVAGEYVAYWRNASPDKELVISAIGVNALLAARVKLNFVTGTAAAGTELTPVNMNKASSKAAPDDSTVMAMEGGAAATGITGLTADGLIDFLFVGADGHEEFRLSDRLRLGQNDAIGVEVDEIASTGDVFGVIFGYYE